MTFGVDPDTHIDSLEQAEAATVEGTSKWSCKLTITGIQNNKKKTNENNQKMQKQSQNVLTCSIYNLLLFLLVPSFLFLELFLHNNSFFFFQNSSELNQNSVKQSQI